MFRKLALILTVLLLNACAASGEGLEYTINETGNAIITKYTGEAETLVIPSEIDGHAVTAIGEDAFGFCKTLTEITLPNTVTIIGNSAFGGCKNLVSVRLSDSLTTIGNDAFYACSALDGIVLPEGLNALGKDAFLYCGSLTAIHLPDSVAEITGNPFRYCEKLTEIAVSPEHPCYALTDGVLFDKRTGTLICYPMTLTDETYTVPQGTTAIGDYAFSYCRNITAVTLPDSVTSIGHDAFTSCRNLFDVIIPASVTTIGENAFKSCEELTLTVEKDSFAKAYCEEYELDYGYGE